MKSNNFQFISPIYDILARLVFVDTIYASQKHFINQLPEEGCVLIIGGGTGKILNLIQLAKPNLKIDFIERSSKMLRKAESRIISSRHQINFILGNEKLLEQKRYDAALCFYFLDLFQSAKLKEVSATIFSCLKDKGILLVSDFSLPKNFHQKIVEKLMFGFLKLTCRLESNSILDYNEFLKHANFKRVKLAFFYRAFIFSAVYIKNY